jgi:hypothetical protein
MQMLYLTHAAPPWSFVPFEGAGHMDCFETHAPLYWPAVEEFIDRIFPEHNDGDAYHHSSR